MKGNLKEKNGITLIALVITIIVMLILVAVTISMAINGGLFEFAGKATRDTKRVQEEENTLAKGEVNVDGKIYESIDDYIAGNEKVVLPTGWERAETTPEGWDTTKVTAITDGTNIVPLPKKYSISEEEGEQSVDTGLVIKDSNENEFVWIPVPETLPLKAATTGNPYRGVVGSGFMEPIVLSSSYDGQTVLNSNYGEGYFDYANDFKYAEEYANMVTSVNKYHGFFIGRYETTIDEEGNVGSVYNTEVLTADKSVVIKEGKTEQICRWYGLYYLQKTTDYIVGNGTTVQTAMIYGQLWDKTMTYIKDKKNAGKTTYDVDTATSSWHGSSNGHTGVVNSAQANVGDVALNIYDLESNGWDWTQESESLYSRVKRRRLFRRLRSSVWSLLIPSYLRR